MKKEQHVDSLFAQRGINVCFNGLGMTDELVNQFIVETQDIVDAEEQHRSMVVKHQLYERVLGRSFAKRQKYTGFEAFFERDIACRIAIRSKNQPVVLVGGDTIQHGSKLTSATSSYIEMLVSELQQLDNIVLFMSGGIDSELVATVLYDHGIKFTPIIFRWLDQDGIARNDNDTVFAMRFCKQRGIAPDVRKLNVPELWSSDEFIQRSAENGIVSAHISTYCEMVNVASVDYPDATFVFGGEVRYKSNPLQFRNMSEPVGSNIVFATKQGLPMIYNAWGSGRAIITTTTQAQLDAASGRTSQSYAPSNSNGNFAFSGPMYAGNSRVQIMMMGGGGGGAGPTIAGSGTYHGGGGGGAGQSNYSGYSLDGAGTDIGYTAVTSGLRFVGTIGSGGAGGAGTNVPGSPGSVTEVQISHIDPVTYNTRQFSRQGGQGGTGVLGGNALRYDGVTNSGGVSAGGAGFTSGGGGGGGSLAGGNSTISFDGAVGGDGVTFTIDYAGLYTGVYTLASGGSGGAGYNGTNYGAYGIAPTTRYIGPGTNWNDVTGPGPNNGAGAGQPAGAGVTSGWGGGGGAYGYSGGDGAAGGLHIAFG